MERLVDPQSRKAAIASYKERKPAYGVFAVICNATGEAWVGCSRTVDTHQNRLWFALRLGSSPHQGVQAAWNEHGGDAFRFEELDRLGDDFSELYRMDELKRRQKLWLARFEANALLPTNAPRGPISRSIEFAKSTNSARAFDEKFSAVISTPSERSCSFFHAMGARRSARIALL